MRVLGRYSLRTTIAALTLCFIILWAGGSVLAQSSTYLPDKVGVWRPWHMSCDGSGRGLTREQNRIYGDKLYKLSEAVHQTPVFNPPLGIEASPSGCVNATIEFLDDYRASQTGPIPGYVMVGTFSYFVPPTTHKLVVADEGPHFFIDVNSLVRVYSGEPEVTHDDGGKIFVAPEIARMQDGFPLYKSGSMVITRIPRPIFQPVSVARFLKAEIGMAQSELAGVQKKLGEITSEEHQRIDQESYRRLKATNPELAERFLRSAQTGDWQAEQTLTNLEQAKQAEIGAYQSELAGLTPEQRGAQAYVIRDGSAASRGLVLAGPSQPGAKPLVCFNPEFYDRSRPRTDIQVLVVGRLYDMSLRQNAQDPEFQRVIDFRRSFDFQTLLRFLDQ